MFHLQPNMNAVKWGKTTVQKTRIVMLTREKHFVSASKDSKLLTDYVRVRDKNLLNSLSITI